MPTKRPSPIAYKGLIILLLVTPALATRTIAQGLTGAPVVPSPPGPPLAAGHHKRTKQPADPYQVAINKRLSDSLISYPGHTSKPVCISIYIDRRGCTDPLFLCFIRSSGSIEADFACFDAALTSAPFPQPLKSDAWNSEYSFYHHYTVDHTRMTQNLIVSAKKNLAHFYFKEHPHLRGKALLTHSIPTSILERYPDAFTPTEIFSADNLKAIDKNLIDPALAELSSYNHFTHYIKDERLINRYKDWVIFQENHPSATRDEIKAEETRLNNKYADLFL
ncbi:MAG: hypothetical protein EKK48_10225 [Candidatus Melainabacteria bacterium]|nr:MAG: hypothetical protein EKK48_10225 [Candidatus Melainabacteria bacterium]